ncbi:UbiA family prenyltransferase [Streptomyces minutiscleroticus]|uniref:Ubiquinone biosynthesis protein UbiA n=1 Tax=Streptomyces minutiscleroticus TaxID=68238 RepID=A0A918NYT6_9ACTN|nr:UbiA family prenyltransferase [Streptomyces minutiscleroticus]GGY07779.1 ubiquinone biosynthesis protein UbiA [Streptomyces minutiscleroticus]
MITTLTAPVVVLQSAWHEIRLSWLFISADRWTTVFPATCFVMAAVVHARLSVPEAAVTVVLGALYFWLFVYEHTLANQLVGVEEDRVNKPFRPLVTGRSSMRGARLRLIVVRIVFPLYGYCLGVLEWALMWQILSLLQHEYGWGRHWVGRNLYAGIGVVAQLAAAWQIVTVITPDAWRWIVTLTVTVTFLMSVQDLRDITGDRAVHRSTMPLVFGETRTRVFLCCGFAVGPVAIHYFLMAPAAQHWWIVATDVLLGALSLLLSVRVVLLRGREADQRSYRLVEQWYTLALAASIYTLR